MTKRNDRVLALLEHVADHDQTPEEAQEELVADGVNADAFLARVQQAVDEKNVVFKMRSRLPVV